MIGQHRIPVEKSNAIFDIKPRPHSRSETCQNRAMLRSCKSIIRTVFHTGPVHNVISITMCLHNYYIHIPFLFWIKAPKEGEHVNFNAGQPQTCLLLNQSWNRDSEPRVLGDHEPFGKGPEDIAGHYFEIGKFETSKSVYQFQCRYVDLVACPRALCKCCSLRSHRPS